MVYLKFTFSELLLFSQIKSILKSKWREATTTTTTSNWERKKTFFLINWYLLLKMKKRLFNNNAIEFLIYVLYGIITQTIHGMSNTHNWRVYDMNYGWKKFENINRVQRYKSVVYVTLLPGRISFDRHTASLWIMKEDRNWRRRSCWRKKSRVI